MFDFNNTLNVDMSPEEFVSWWFERADVNSNDTVSEPFEVNTDEERIALAVLVGRWTNRGVTHACIPWTKLGLDSKLWDELTERYGLKKSPRKTKPLAALTLDAPEELPDIGKIDDLTDKELVIKYYEATNLVVGAIELRKAYTGNKPLPKEEFDKFKDIIDNASKEQLEEIARLSRAKLASLKCVNVPVPSEIKSFMMSTINTKKTCTDSIVNKFIVGATLVDYDATDVNILNKQDTEVYPAFPSGHPLTGIVPVPADLTIEVANTPSDWKDLLNYEGIAEDAKLLENPDNYKPYMYRNNKLNLALLCTYLHLQYNARLTPIMLTELSKLGKIKLL